MWCVIKKSDKGIGVKTFDGWDWFSAKHVEQKGIDFTNAMRFTNGEASKQAARGELPVGCHFRWLGCYKELDK